MADPVIHLLAGPNGAGKTTFYEQVLAPVTHLEFVNADAIAAQTWPGSEVERSYDAAAIAAARRSDLIDGRRSFVTETVFSHESKVDLVRDAVANGFLVSLHIIVIPEALSVARVQNRVENGGHHVPEDKVRARYQRLWHHVAEAIEVAHDATVYDNSRAASPFRVVARYAHGRLVGQPDWPPWAPPELRDR